MRELGWKEIDCVVLDIDEKKAREYRLADNKIQENSSWNEESLLLEIRDLDIDKIKVYFPDIDVEAPDIDVDDISDDDITETEDELENKYKKLADEANSSKQKITCPNCFQDFYLSKKDIELYDKEK